MNNSWEDILLWPKSTLMASQYAPLILASTVGAGAYFGFQMDGLESVGLFYASGAAAVWAFPGFVTPPITGPSTNLRYPSDPLKYPSDPLRHPSTPTNPVFLHFPQMAVINHDIGGYNFNYQQAYDACIANPACGGFEINDDGSSTLLSDFTAADVVHNPGGAGQKIDLYMKIK